MTVQRTDDNYIVIIWDEETQFSKRQSVPVKICNNFKKWFEEIGVSFDKIKHLLTEEEKTELEQWMKK